MKNIGIWLKTRQATAIFSAIALVGGVIFISEPPITGGVISTGNYPIDFLSIIGILLIIGSAILGAYSIKKR